jgi:hypothetical protein
VCVCGTKFRVRLFVWGWGVGWLLGPPSRDRAGGGVAYECGGLAQSCSWRVAWVDVACSVRSHGMWVGVRGCFGVGFLCVVCVCV